MSSTLTLVTMSYYVLLERTDERIVIRSSGIEVPNTDVVKVVYLGTRLTEHYIPVKVYNVFFVDGTGGEYFQLTTFSKFDNELHLYDANRVNVAFRLKYGEV